ncbi:hypothetical protein LP316_03800 [Thalassotalea sp. LPB0316]|uniref:hypothetical protein n=1 Tax=Thalassotalea sp. LPB0316 TaxID=2769490 RepID=UPI001869597F|nr:hypothetical protein [Thalassotalea sp. LPB0316]QOL26436.1 hypothetical protein LP316_03800 [Thalassotalea sp. LPB0316]
MKLVQQDLKQSTGWLSQNQQAQLLPLIEQSFSDVDAQAYLTKYFTANDAFDRRLRLYYAGERIVGYCLLTLHHQQGIILVKASAAFYPEFRQGGNTFSFSLLEVTKLKLRHPFRRIYYADTMLSPAMYRAMAKNVAHVYPAPDMPANTETLFKQFNANGIYSEYAKRTCLVDAGRKTNYSAEEVASFKQNNKPEISYYCKANPNFDRGIALFVIMPITLRQFIATAIKLLVQ